jgi:hypothetical protein
MKSHPHIVVIVAAFVGMFLLGIVNRLHAIGDWSTPADLVGSVVLFIVAVTAWIFGTRRDRDRERSEPDNDY